MDPEKCKGGARRKIPATRQLLLGEDWTEISELPWPRIPRIAS